LWIWIRSRWSRGVGQAAAGRPELANRCPIELRKALGQLKRGVKPNREEIGKIRQEIGTAPWVKLKRINRVFDLPCRYRLPRRLEGLARAKPCSDTATTRQLTRVAVSGNGAFRPQRRFPSGERSRSRRWVNFRVVRHQGRDRRLRQFRDADSTFCGLCPQGQDKNLGCATSGLPPTSTVRTNAPRHPGRPAAPLQPEPRQGIPHGHGEDTIETTGICRVDAALPETCERTRSAQKPLHSFHVGLLPKAFRKAVSSTLTRNCQPSSPIRSRKIVNEPPSVPISSTISGSTLHFLEAVPVVGIVRSDSTASASAALSSLSPLNTAYIGKTFSANAELTTSSIDLTVAMNNSIFESFP